MVGGPGSLASASSSDVAAAAGDASERLRVLFVTAWYPTAERPVEGIFIREHALAAARRHDVAVLHLRSPLREIRGLWRLEEETDPSLSAGLPTFRLRHRRLPIAKATGAVAPWAADRAFRRIVAGGFRPDLIHAHVYEAGAVAALLSRFHRVPLVVSEHFTGFNRRTLTRSQLAKARLAFRSAAYVLPVSRQLAEAIEGYGLPGRFRVVPNAVDLTLFEPRDGTPSRDERRFLFVGALEATHKKGVPTLLEALASLRTSRTDWRLDVIGEGVSRAEYERRAVELGLADAVTFHGSLPKPAVARAMQDADLLVLPSVWENLPCVIAEAMASGLPVVATKTGGVPEMVSEATGSLVEPGDAEALAAALDRTLGRLGEYEPEAIRAIAAERYGMEAVADQLAAVYASVVAERARPG